MTNNSGLPSGGTLRGTSGGTTGGSAGTGAPPPASPIASVAATAFSFIRRVPPIFFVLLVLIVWISTINPRFATAPGFLSFLMRAAPIAILAAGQLFVIVSGGFDLSVGSMVTLVVLGSSMLIDGDPANTWWAIALMFLIGIAVGLFNGAITSFLRVPSFITTLGMLLTLKGFALLWTGGAPRGFLPPNFRMFGRNRLADVPLLGDVPYSVIILLVVGAVAIYLMHRTGFGKQVVALGDNARAAALSGMHVAKVRMAAFVASSTSAVIAGILLGGFSGVSTNVGDGLELESISAAVLGGAKLLGGRGSMPGAIAGAITLQTLFTLLNLLGWPKPLRDGTQGLIIIGAVAYAMWRERRAE